MAFFHCLSSVVKNSWLSWYVTLDSWIGMRTVVQKCIQLFQLDHVKSNEGRWSIFKTIKPGFYELQTTIMLFNAQCALRIQFSRWIWKELLVKILDLCNAGKKVASIFSCSIHKALKTIHINIMSRQLSYTVRLPCSDTFTINRKCTYLKK